MSTKATVYTLALLAGLVAATISWFAPFFPYKVDSASYIEQARSFLAHGVFETTPFATGEPDVISVPDKLFPPGFPLLIALSSVIFQLPVEVIAPFLSLAALLLLPTVILFTFQRIIGLWSALCIGVLVVLTPVAVKYGYIAYSDTISLLLVIYCVNRVLKADNNIWSWFYLGLLTGFSYLLRNANLALLITLFLFIIWELIVEPENRKQKIKSALFWLLGNTLIIVPWLIRNTLVFGKFQPYSMEQSTVGLRENIQDYSKAQLDTLLTFSELDNTIAGSVPGIILLFISMLILVHQLVSTWAHWKKIEQKTFLISVVYVAIGAAMTIAARTKYQWGIHIDARYALPYSCFIFVAVLIIFRNSALKIMSTYLLPIFALSLLLVRFYELPKLYQTDQYHQTVRGAAYKIVHNPDAICTNLNGRFAVSNYAFVYRILCAAPVRHVFPTFEHNKFLDESLNSWAELGAKKGIVVSIFPYLNDKQNNLPLKKEELIKLNALGWQVERNDRENLILSHKAALTIN